MKKIILVGVLAFVWLLFAAAPPPPSPREWINMWTTNRPPKAVEGSNNLSISNVFSGTAWLFYAVGPKTVARLSDVTNVANAVVGASNGNWVASMNGRGTNNTFETPTNVFGVNEGDFNVVGGDVYLGSAGLALENDGGNISFAGGGVYFFTDGSEIQVNNPLVVLTTQTNSSTVDISGALTLYGQLLLPTTLTPLRIGTEKLQLFDTFSFLYGTVLTLDDDDATLIGTNSIALRSYGTFGLGDLVWVGNELYPGNARTDLGVTVPFHAFKSTNIYALNSTASRAAVHGPDGILTNSVVTTTELALLSGKTSVAQNTVTNGLGTDKVNIQSGVANTPALTNAYLLGTNFFFGPNTNIVCVVSNSSTTGAGMLYFFRLTNGSTFVYPPIMSMNLTNGNVGIGTNAPAVALELQGSAQVSGSITVKANSTFGANGGVLLNNNVNLQASSSSIVFNNGAENMYHFGTGTNGLGQGSTATPAGSIIASNSVWKGNLVSQNTASIPTNTAATTTSSPAAEFAGGAAALNTWATNAAQRTFNYVVFSCSSGVTAPVDLRVVVDDTADGTWDKEIPFGEPANITGTWTNTISFMMSPNARWAITNLSGVGATATLIAVKRDLL